MRNRRSDPARGARCSRESGEASAAADEKGKSTRAADGRKQQKKEYRAPALVSGSDLKHGGEIARSKHRRTLSRSTSPVNDVQEASGEASALVGGKKSKRMYRTQKKKSRTRNSERRSFEVEDDAFAGEVSATQLSVQAAGTRLMVYHHPTEAKLVGGHACPAEETKIQNQQQNDPNTPYLHHSHDGSTPEEAMEASLVVANATSTQPKIQISAEKTKVQSTPTVEDLGRIGQDGGNSDRIAHVMVHEQEPQLECLDWDSNKLRMEIQFYLDQLDFGPPDAADDDDDEFCAEYEEPELTQLKERLALHRIIAHEISENRQPPDDAKLREKYPPPILKEEWYFEEYERSLEWCFYPEYCMYVGFQDYQRLVLHDKNEYHDWQRYRKTNSTYEVDREFVKYYEKLASETKWIEKCLTDKKLEWGELSVWLFIKQ